MTRRNHSLIVLTIGIVLLIALATNVQALPEESGYMVNDFAYLLTWEEDNSLEDFCRFIEEETTVEVYILTTTDLEGYDLNEYSYRIFNDWGIGKDDVNNGLLITFYYIDINETHFGYEFRIEIGRGLEGAITDSEAGCIGRDNMSIWFNWAYFYEGFYEGIEELYYEFEDDPSVVSGSGGPEGLSAVQAWAYYNPIIPGILLAIGLWFCGMWLQVYAYRGGRVLLPMIAIVCLLLFGWWLDYSLMVLFYAIAFSLGATVTIRGIGRVRGGGGRSEGGGWSTY